MSTERIAQIAKGMAHPVRVGILQQFLAHRPQTCQEVVNEFDLAQSTVSEHLRILREAGLLTATTDGPRTWHCLRRSALRQFAATIRDLADVAEPLELEINTRVSAS